MVWLGCEDCSVALFIPTAASWLLVPTPDLGNPMASFTLHCVPRVDVCKAQSTGCKFSFRLTGLQLNLISLFVVSHTAAVLVRDAIPVALLSTVVARRSPSAVHSS